MPREVLTVHAVLKKPRARKLITDETSVTTGGTWHRHGVITNVPTEMFLIGASRTPPSFNGDGIPQLIDADGGPTTPSAPLSRRPATRSSYSRWCRVIITSSRRW
jgi:hypothetical protein